MTYLAEIALATSAVIILHHRYSHNDDETLTDFEKFFQVTDVQNHETWALVFLGISIAAYVERQKLLR